MKNNSLIYQTHVFQMDIFVRIKSKVKNLFFLSLLSKAKNTKVFFLQLPKEGGLKLKN